VKLTKEEREKFEALIRTGKPSADRFSQASALVLCDVGMDCGDRWKTALIELQSRPRKDI
jgi:hypothetical protein